MLVNCSVELSPIALVSVCQFNHCCRAEVLPGPLPSPITIILSKELREASLLIFLNKQDEASSVTIEEITEKFALYKLFCGRSWHIQACDAVSGTGLTDGLDWLSRQLVTAIP